MLKILVVSLLIVSYIDTINIAIPKPEQIEGVRMDIMWATIHTLAYSLAIGIILFKL